MRDLHQPSSYHVGSWKQEARLMMRDTERANAPEVIKRHARGRGICMSALRTLTA